MVFKDTMTVSTLKAFFVLSRMLQGRDVNLPFMKASMLPQYPKLIQFRPQLVLLPAFECDTNSAGFS